MIVYEATKEEFCDSVLIGSITDEIYDVYRQKIGKSAKSQIRSWENSMEFMYKILIDDGFIATNKLLEQYGESQITNSKYNMIVDSLVEMQCIEITEGTIGLIEYISKEYIYSI